MQILMSLIPTFFLKKDFSSKFEIGISKNIKNLTDCSRLLDEILNRKPNNIYHMSEQLLFHIRGDYMYPLYKKIQKLMNISIQKRLVTQEILLFLINLEKSNIIISRLKSIGVDIQENDPKIKKLIR